MSLWFRAHGTLKTELQCSSTAIMKTEQIDGCSTMRSIKMLIL